MKSIDDYNSGIFLAKNKKSEGSHLGSPESWLNEHGQPNFDYLKSLAEANTAEALEELMYIADDLDVDYHPDIPSEELIEKIRLAVSKYEAGENEHVVR